MVIRRTRDQARSQAREEYSVRLDAFNAITRAREDRLASQTPAEAEAEARAIREERQLTAHRTPVEANHCEVNVAKQAEQAMLLNSTKSLEDYVLNWKRSPYVNPYTSVKVAISLYPYGEYVCLYKHFMDELVSKILKSRTNKVLSVEECHRIKNSLPNEHARVIFENFNFSIVSGIATMKLKEISYDYLFIKYFIKSKTIKYDPAFIDELTIHLDLAVYHTSKYQEYKDEEILDSSKRDQSDFLPMLRKNYTIKYFYIELFLNEYLKIDRIFEEYSLYSLVLNTCVDIEQFNKYMIVETKQEIESDVIERVNYNMKVLEYYKQIFEIVPNTILKRFLKNISNPFGTSYEYQKYYLRYQIRDLFISELVIKKEFVRKELVEIYDTILRHIQLRRYFDTTEIVDNVFETLISIYESILKLYRKKENNAIYKDYIKDLTLNKRIELQEPMNIKKRLPGDLQRFKMDLIKYEIPPAPPVYPIGRIRNPQSPPTEYELYEQFNLKKSSNEKKLKEFEEKMKEESNDHKEKMKEYNLKKEKDDKFKKEIYEGKYSPKIHLLSLKAYKKQQKEEPLLQVSKRKAKSESIIIPRSYSDSDKVKALKQKVEGNQVKVIMKELPDYPNEIDPYTQETFSDMNPKKLKYLSNIVYNDGKRDFNYRFDTVTIYNYILKCIDNCDKPKNLFTNTNLTDVNLKEICTKIKHFTKKPTYSSSEIVDLLAKCDESKINNIYDNCLRFKAEVLSLEGKLNLYLWIKLGNISFKVTSKKVLTLPIFINDPVLTEEQYNTIIYKVLEGLPDGSRYVPNMNLSITDKVLFEVLYKLKLGVLTSNRFFPYRKNKPILFNLPQFLFYDDEDKTLKRFERYIKRIENI
jgi:hypothetical protein